MGGHEVNKSSVDILLINLYTTCMEFKTPSAL